MAKKDNNQGNEEEKDKVLYLRIDPDLHNAMSILAKKNRRSLTGQAEFALDEYATKYNVS